MKEEIKINKEQLKNIARKVGKWCFEEEEGTYKSLDDLVEEIFNNIENSSIKDMEIDEVSNKARTLIEGLPKKLKNLETNIKSRIELEKDGSFYYYKDSNPDKNYLPKGMKSWYEEAKKETNKNKGQKHDKGKLPYYTVLFKQFPAALKEVVKRSNYGHNKYKETDQDWMNFKRVDNKDNRYLNAAMRHLKDWGKEDYEASGTSHAGAVIWNLLAQLEKELE